MCIRDSVWVDHNVFTDAPKTDDQLPIENGKIKQCHDGALDVKNASDYVTVSNNRFELHAKNNLVGSSDSRTTDDGHLTVTFNNNHYLNIVNPCDVNPVWDPNDGSTGNWNSQFDSVVISGSKNVWVDHNVFTDAPLTDDKLPISNGKIKQCHDGALDVKNGSDYVTISNNRFELHQKNNLVGSSDSTTSDDGHLTVTFNNNHFLHVSERSPRVRFGKVHIYNNYFEGSRSHAVYPHHYSIGVAYLAKIISQNNAFDIAGASTCANILTNPGSSSKTGAITDSGSLLNGAALDVAGKCSFSASVGWTLPYTVQLLSTSAVKQSVLSNAGTGKLTGN